MYTRCPWCQTIYNLTPAQLKARQGLVRCGQCAKVFQADQHLLTRLPRAPAGKPAPAKPGGAPRPPARPTPAARVEQARVPEPIPLISDLSSPAPAARATRPGFLIAGSGVLTLMLIGQLLFFYPGDMAPPESPWRPAVARLCETLGCNLVPRQHLGLIELVETRVAPHPPYDKALRIHATLVNRADTVQPFPLMEVSLTSLNGLTVARRDFAPAEYLESPAQAQEGMPSHVAMAVQLDITHPDRRALGYEIQLLPAQ
jgi:predicted Zn finger-like uncharacterized protein